MALGCGQRSTVDALVSILRDFKPEIESGRVRVHVADDRATLKELPNHDEASAQWAIRRAA
jgi:hypothetical protein